MSANNNQALAFVLIVLLAFVASAAVARTASTQVTNTGVSLNDGDKCEDGKDCTCGNVVCMKGCKCSKTGPTGICIDCPIPTVPPATDQAPPTTDWRYIIAGAVVLVGAVWLFFRAKRRTP
jgi:hypothetical protein